jgi:hypothetical protein
MFDLITPSIKTNELKSVIDMLTFCLKKKEHKPNRSSDHD